MRRTVGPPTDRRFVHASKLCNGSDPENFKFDTCSDLITCIYAHITQALAASLSSGTNIAALLPTILVLIGKATIDSPFIKQRDNTTVDVLITLYRQVKSKLWLLPNLCLIYLQLRFTTP